MSIDNSNKLNILMGTSYFQEKKQLLLTDSFIEYPKIIKP